MKSTSKKRTPNIVNLTVKRLYLTEREVERLMDCARKHGRYGHRDATMILVAYRHGLRASEVCDLQWQQIELSEGRLHVHRVKNGIPSVHPIRGDEMRALRKLRREYPKDAHVFVSERGGPISPIGFHRLVQRLGEAAKMPFPIHPHMLRHACGFKLANDGHDTRALQHYLRHKNIQHTVRYTDMATMTGQDPSRRTERSSHSKKTTRHIVEITRPLAVGPCVACAPSGRLPCRPPASAGSWACERSPWRLLVLSSPPSL